MSLLLLICFSSGVYVYLYVRILMYVKCHEQFKIGCDAILNKIYYYVIIIIINHNRLLN